MISFDKNLNLFTIDTKNTTYAFSVLYGKFLAHLYYGEKTDSVKILKQFNFEKRLPFCPGPDELSSSFSLENLPTELSFFDSGDNTDTGVRIKNHTGSSVTLFYYKGYSIYNGRDVIPDMPYSRNGDKTLEIILEDEFTKCELHSYYVVYFDTDTIVRYNKIINKGNDVVLIERLCSCQLDFYDKEFEFLALNGKWADERNELKYPVHYGKQGIYSKRGHSSHTFNPFMALKEDGADEDNGNVYGFILIYSGDFEMQTEKVSDGKIRTLVGLNRDTFSWNLVQNAEFVTPEVILTCSLNGVGQMSRNFHDHLRNNVINPKYVNAKRPLVLNTWESAYFGIDEDKLLDYAKSAVGLGIDTFVVDDGWFGKRNGETAGLGDWYVNTDKFKSGLKEFSEKIHGLGLNFGIWIEPEMINVDSDLYRKHPEWVLQSEGRKTSFGRHQLVLDLTRDEVINYIVNNIKETFKGVKLEYIKWDFNRTLTEAGSLALSKERQCEAKHRFQLGCYKMHKLFIEAFPDVMFEGCSGGGGRFDAGIMFYCPQIWTSDNTDPMDRIRIQYGTSIAYPLSTLSAHVSNTLFNKWEKQPDYNFRFCVSSFGVLGYEFDVRKLTDKERKEIRQLNAFYREIDSLILSGDLYRGDYCKDGFSLTVVSKDKSSFYHVFFGFNCKGFTRIKGIKEDGKYYEYCSGKKYKGKNLLEKFNTRKMPYGIIYMLEKK